jgi:hypothetical protein
MCLILLFIVGNLSRLGAAHLSEYGLQSVGHSADSFTQTGPDLGDLRSSWKPFLNSAFCPLCLGVLDS